MKRFLLVMFFFALLNLSAFARRQDRAFSLVIHVTAVHMEEGQAGLTGSGSTDSNGNYSSTVDGGGSYTWHIYTAQIEGDNKTYGLSTARMHYKGGMGLALATMGWSAVATARRNYGLSIGEYHGRWNKDGTLEIQFIDAKGKQMHQTFRIESEEITPALSTPTAEQIAARDAQLKSCLVLAKDNPSISCK